MPWNSPIPSPWETARHATKGKLAATLTDNNFTIETCKSCHPVTGGTDLPSATGGFTVDTRTKNALNKQAPALASILPPGLTAHNPPFATACTGCHATGGIAPVFATIHTGYDKVIYGVPGTKYSTAITVTIDNVSYVDNTNTLKFGFLRRGVPEWVAKRLTRRISSQPFWSDCMASTSKDYLFGPHESYPSTYPDNAKRQEVPGIQHRNPNRREQLRLHNGNENRQRLECYGEPVRLESLDRQWLRKESGSCGHACSEKCGQCRRRARCSFQDLQPCYQGF